MAVEFRRSLSTPGDVNAGSSNRRSVAKSQQGHHRNEDSYTEAVPAELASTASLPPLKPDLNLSDRTLFAVYCFFKNFIGTASGSNAVAIDNKIEQAMDLVKSHLMFAVREEVEVLKEKIAELMDRINQLEIENSILKSNASQETLAQLSTHMAAAAAAAAVTTAPSVGVSTTTSTQAPSGPANGQPP